jgi:hypothetical protein
MQGPCGCCRSCSRLRSAAPAHAQPAAEEEIGASAPTGPGLASSTALFEPGRVQVELAIDWSFQEDGDARHRYPCLPATRWCMDRGSTSALRSSSAGPPTAASLDRIGREVTSDDSVRRCLSSVFAAASTTRTGVACRAPGPRLAPDRRLGDRRRGVGRRAARPLNLELAASIWRYPSIAAAPGDAGRRGRHSPYGNGRGPAFNLFPKRLSAM